MRPLRSLSDFPCSLVSSCLRTNSLHIFFPFLALFFRRQSSEGGAKKRCFGIFFPFFLFFLSREIARKLEALQWMKKKALWLTLTNTLENKNLITRKEMKRTASFNYKNPFGSLSHSSTRKKLKKLDTNDKNFPSSSQKKKLHTRLLLAQRWVLKFLQQK